MNNSNSFSAPSTADHGVYPFNHVRQTRSGHVFEVDDTLGEERIHERHKSGTERTILADGTRRVTVVCDNFTTVIGDDYVNINGNTNVYVNGNVNMSVNGDYNLEVNGSMNQTVKGEYRLKVGAAHKTEVGADSAINIVGKQDVIVGNGMNNTIRGGGIKTMSIGGIEETLTGDRVTITTGSISFTGLTGFSATSPAGATTIGGLSVAVDSASILSLTSLGLTNMTSALTNVTTSVVNILGGALVATLDVAALGGMRTLATHIHLGDGTGSTPAPTSPPIL